MSEKESSTEQLIQRINQLLDVLNMVSKDLSEISKALRTVSAPTAPVAPTEKMRAIPGVEALFPKDLAEMLDFEEKEKFIVIRPRKFLGSENFAKIASIVREAGGEYISAGKESHFRLPK